MKYISNSRHFLVLLAFAVMFSGVSATHGQSEDFRMQTSVFVGNSSAPAVSSLTMFNGTTIYDFIENESEFGEITVFDVKRGRFVLLDPHRKVKTTLTKDFLVQFLDQVLSQTSSTALTKYVQPKLQYEFNLSMKTVRVTSDHLTYQATGISPKFDSSIQRYRHFADWVARLNSTRIGNLPPYSRFELNRLMAKQKLLPKSIKRTLMLDEVGLRKQIVRSEHVINWQLTNTDRKRISQTGDQMATFKEVSADEFWQLKTKAVQSNR
jgi:hypothetical protein|tara:strand:- start:773 stop:1570 length:798 start_codon:yes stop_codon:yes gene_type:complete